MPGYKFTRFPGRGSSYTRTHVQIQRLIAGDKWKHVLVRGGYLLFELDSRPAAHLRPFFPRSDERVSNVRSLFLGHGAQRARRGAACQREEVVFLTFQYLLYY